MSRKYFVPALAAAGLVTFAAMGYSQPHEKGAAAGSGITKAIAVMHPTKGQKVEGTVTFTKVENGVRVQAHIHGLAAGKHGFHIHEFGDCSSPDGMSTGGHFNPEKADDFKTQPTGNAGGRVSCGVIGVAKGS